MTMPISTHMQLRMRKTGSRVTSKTPKGANATEECSIAKPKCNGLGRCAKCYLSKWLKQNDTKEKRTRANYQLCWMKHIRSNGKTKEWFCGWKMLFPYLGFHGCSINQALPQLKEHDTHTGVLKRSRSVGDSDQLHSIMLGLTCRTHSGSIVCVYSIPSHLYSLRDAEHRNERFELPSRILHSQKRMFPFANWFHFRFAFMKKQILSACIFQKHPMGHMV